MMRDGISPKGERMTQEAVSDPDSAAAITDLTALAARGQPAAVHSLIRQIRPMVVRHSQARLGNLAGHYPAPEDVAPGVSRAGLTALPRDRGMAAPVAPFGFGCRLH